MKGRIDLVIKNIGMLATPQGTGPLKGKNQGQVKCLEDAFIAIKGERIVAIGKEDDFNKLQTGHDTVFIDAKGSLVTPGLVDPHTHLVFGGWRQKELSLKLKGVSYIDILEMGGGILNTVRHTREASFEGLMKKCERSLDIMLLHGTTTCEAKSGYGLNTKDEIKTLEVIKALNKSHVMDIVPTFMGAHAIPIEYKDMPDEFIKLIRNDMIPRVAKRGWRNFVMCFAKTGFLMWNNQGSYLKQARNTVLKLKSMRMR